MESALREAIQAGIKEEMGAMPDARLDSDPLELKFRSLGARPAGKISENSPFFELVQNVERYLGNHSRSERSSTDANIPLSAGIPAIAIGGGGRGGGSHTLAEWYDPTDRELGLKRLFLIALSTAGIQP
jgi:hypothetical protein